MSRRQGNDPRGLCSTYADHEKAVYILDWSVYSYTNMRDGEAENAAAFEFKLQRHSGGLRPGQATPLLYRNLRKLPRAIANARWISRTLHLRPTSSFNIGNHTAPILV